MWAVTIEIHTIPPERGKLTPAKTGGTYRPPVPCVPMSPDMGFSGTEGQEGQGLLGDSSDTHIAGEADA